MNLVQSTILKVCNSNATMSFNKFELKTRCKIKLAYTRSYNVISFNNMIKYHDVLPTNITLKL